MSVLVDVMEDMKLNRAGRDNTSPKQKEDLTAAISAMSNGIMTAILASDELCIHQCRFTTDVYKIAAAELQETIDEIKKSGEAAKNDLAALEQKKAKLEQDWERRVTDYTCANLEERERCVEGTNFVKKVAKTAGVDMRVSVAALKQKLKDEMWWQEVEGILEQKIE